MLLILTELASESSPVSPGKEKPFPLRPVLYRPIGVCDVIGFVSVIRVMLCDQERGRFSSRSLLVFGQSQLYLGELAVGGLGRFVQP